MSSAVSREQRAKAVRLFAIGATVTALGLRAAHHTFVDRVDGLSDAVGALLRLQFGIILVQLTALLPVSIALGVVTGGLWLFRRSALIDLEPEGWRTRGWFSALLWMQIFLVNFLIDIDPRLALGFGAGIVWHLVLSSAALRRRGVSAAFRWLSWGALFLAVAPWQVTFSDRLCLAVWCGLQPWLSAIVVRATRLSDRLWPATLSVMVGQLLAAATPYFISDSVLPLTMLTFVVLRAGYRRILGQRARWYWRLAVTCAALVLSLKIGHDVAQSLPRDVGGAPAMRLGDELAYNYCESTSRGRLAVTVPVCSGPGGPQCVDGRVDLFDLAELDFVESLHPFDEQFYGRLEQVICEEDFLLVGMCCASPEGRQNELATMSMDWTGRVLDESLLDEYQTHRVLYDAPTNALWLAGSELVRKDLSTGEATVLARRKPPGIFNLENHAKSELSRSVFIAEFINADAVREFDLESLKEKRRIDTHNGSVVAVTVDDPMQRLYVTGLWGVDVYDLVSGDRVTSNRLGFAARTPLVDERHDLVYIPSTTNGKIHVLDRSSGEILGAISIGFGARNVFLANQGRWLLASAQHGLWYWEAASLAAQFRDQH